MIIIYTPEGGEPEHYDARTVLVSEASIVSRTLDQKWAEIKKGVEEEDPEAMRGVVWILKKRHNATLRYGDFDPGVEEMVTRLDKREVRTYVTEAVAVASLNPDITPEQIRLALVELPPLAVDPQHALAVIEELVTDPKGEPDPKADGPSSSPSPTSSLPEIDTSAALPIS